MLASVAGAVTCWIRCFSSGVASRWCPSFALGVAASGDGCVPLLPAVVVIGGYSGVTAVVLSHRFVLGGGVPLSLLLGARVGTNVFVFISFGDVVLG